MRCCARHQHRDTKTAVAVRAVELERTPVLCCRHPWAKAGGCWASWAWCCCWGWGWRAPRGVRWEEKVTHAWMARMVHGTNLYIYIIERESCLKLAMMNLTKIYAEWSDWDPAWHQNTWQIGHQERMGHATQVENKWNTYETKRP